MCTIPPPPALPAVINNTIIGNNNFKTEVINDSFCLWASEYTALQQACIRREVCKSSAPYKYSYKMMPSILQQGPTCGLVALAMIVNNCNLNIKEVLEIAKENGYSKYGEMFSCKNMVKLTKIMFEKYNIKNTEIILRKGELCGDFIISKLLDKCIILVPYDADHNHYPCLNGGYKAHWAVISGIIIPTEQHTPADCIVISHQGKSRRPGLWPLSDLERSNKNLHQYKHEGKAIEHIYVYPKGGIGGENGLCDQYILIEGLDQQTSAV